MVGDIMGKINYTIEDKKIAELLGVQNFSTSESAILELVKNAYDANATTVSIKFSIKEESPMLTIIDDGDGMDSLIVSTKWMHVGKSDKNYFVEGNEKRVSAGSMGIGRFALARLANNVIMISKRLNEEPVKWITDWEESSITDSPLKSDKGTVFELFKLRDNWDEILFEKLHDFL